ncbi:MAG: DeoR/GlpR family DNA-binding transcription regulator, partial [Oscillospiraceae bacterium]|nr:DeoR/GlpR family DNA-binding transcription regulator [Oscillospiraceae bacterium]
MPSNSRGELILEHLREKSRFMTVEQLRRDLYVSAATIRRDLSALAQSGLIRRTRGGALLVEGITSEDPMPFRENKNAAQKQIIADMALKHVRDGMTLFLDSSTTALTFARGLSRFSNLRVVTNGLKTA